MAGQVPDTGLPVGTVLTWNGHVSQSLWSGIKTGIFTEADLFRAIKQPLLGKWGLEVVSTDYGELAAVATGAAEALKIVVQMDGPQTYAQPSDVSSIIAGEIGNALGGNYLVDSDISDWTIPRSAGGSGSSVETGAPAASTSAVGGVFESIGSGIANTVKDATSGLGVGTGVIVVILGLAIIAAVLIAVSPTAPARAIAAARRGR